jgi:hypothetical protein
MVKEKIGKVLNISGKKRGTGERDYKNGMVNQSTDYTMTYMP